MYPLSIRVAVDIGSACHRAAVGLPDGKLLDRSTGSVLTFQQNVGMLELTPIVWN